MGQILPFSVSFSLLQEFRERLDHYHRVKLGGRESDYEDPVVSWFGNEYVIDFRYPFLFLPTSPLLG